MLDPPRITEEVLREELGEGSEAGGLGVFGLAK